MRASRVWVPGLLVLLGGAASALAAGGPTGNSKAIAIARAEAHAYTQIRVERYTETGFIEMTDQEGRTSYLSFNWDQPKLSPGWVWATEHGVVALSHGRVVWWRDDLTPPPCTGLASATRFRSSCYPNEAAPTTRSGTPLITLAMDGCAVISPWWWERSGTGSPGTSRPPSSVRER